MALTSSCSNKQPHISLITHKIVADFPSASAVEYDAHKLYVFGDDAAYLLIMDTAYNRLDTILYSTDTSYRISKDVKLDIESATIINDGNEKHLYALGSLSDTNRSYIFYFPLKDPDTYLSMNYAPFAKLLTGIPEINIEGMAFVKSHLVMANRANRSNRMNQLIFGGRNPNDYRSLASLRIIDLVTDNKNVLGVSGLYYHEEKDILYFTMSEEDTYSATADGAISDSYIGWINRFSLMMEDKSVQPDALVKLSDIDPVFTRQKIESVCVQRSNDQETILHLVADNDNGQSSFFKLRLAW